MAPPPPASMPLQQRLMALAQTLQFGWFVGHLTLLFCTLRYGLSYITFNFNSSWASFSYRTAFVAAAATYGIVVYKAYRSRMRPGARPQGGNLAMVTDENVQYLFMAFVWLFSRQVPLALLPFAVYSVFHVATYTRANLIPIFFPQPAAAPTGTSPGQRPAAKSHPLADQIGRFVKDYYDASMSLVAALELALWFRLVGSFITMTRGSWVLLIIYTVFLRSRYSQSTFVQSVFHNAGARVDALVGQQSTPPVARQVWGTIKGGIKSFTEMTDLRKYVGAQPMKKAS